jgi:putative membrane protein
MRKVFSVAVVLAIGVVVIAASSASQAQPFYGSGMMRGYGTGGGCFGRSGYWGNSGNLNLSTDDVKNCLERTIRNPNLKVGDVKEKDADTITADIVTKDKDGLVQSLSFNRHSGLLTTGAWSMGYGYGSHWGMMDGWGYGYGFGLAHMIIWVIILIAIVVGIIWLVRSLAASGGRQGLPRRSAGLDVLEERYARGEINRDEYLQKKRDLGG